MRIRLQKQLDLRRSLGRDNGEDSELARRQVHPWDEAEDIRIKGEPLAWSPTMTLVRLIRIGPDLYAPRLAQAQSRKALSTQPSVPFSART